MFWQSWQLFWGCKKYASIPSLTGLSKYLNNYFNFHIGLSIHLFIRFSASSCAWKVSSIPVVLSQINKSCLVLMCLERKIEYILGHPQIPVSKQLLVDAWQFLTHWNFTHHILPILLSKTFILCISNLNENTLCAF